MYAPSEPNGRCEAERVGFEPTVEGTSTTVFETAPIGRSGTSPMLSIITKSRWNYQEAVFNLENPANNYGGVSAVTGLGFRRSRLMRNCRDLFNPCRFRLFTRKEAGYFRSAHRAFALRHPSAAFRYFNSTILDRSFCATFDAIGFKIHRISSLLQNMAYRHILTPLSRFL